MCVLCLNKAVSMYWLLLVLVYVDFIGLSSAYEKTGACSCGMSDMYKLKSMGERTPPWGMQVLN